jgi:hypothetical protein
MAIDLFGIDTQIGGAWQLEGAVLHIEGAEELIVTDAGITYTRTSTKFSPLNQKKKYTATGEASGGITLGAVIGPSRAIKDFLTRYADPCQLGRNVLTLQPTGVRDCDSNDFNAIEFVCNGVLIQSFNVRVTQLGQNMTIVTAGLGLSFISLQIK